MYRITVEGPDLEEPVVFEYERVTVAKERGVERVYTPRSEPLSDPYDLVSNGQRRLLLKAWSGCRDYESFVTSEEIR